VDEGCTSPSIFEKISASRWRGCTCLFGSKMEQFGHFWFKNGNFGQNFGSKTVGNNIRGTKGKNFKFFQECGCTPLYFLNYALGAGSKK
jgi:hypothetical protein